MNLLYFFIIFLNNIYYPKNLHISKNEIIPNTLKYSDTLYFIKLWFCKEYIFIFNNKFHVIKIIIIVFKVIYIVPISK